MKKEILSGLSGLCVSLAIAAPATTNDIYVGASYTPDATHFNTIQAAFDAVPAEQDSDAYVIHLAAGEYDERVVVSNAVRNVMLLGDERHPEKYVQKWNVGGGDTSFWLNNKGIKNFEARGVTFYNYAWQRYWDGEQYTESQFGPGQALAMKTSTGGNPCIFRHCRMISGQDTFYINGGPVYCEDCFIAGAVDFIYGEACGLFNRCELFSNDGGYFTADGHGNKGEGYVNIGYLFYKCRFNVAEGKSATLGRSWRDGANVWLADCYIGPGVKPELWSYWNDVKGKTVLRDYGTRSDVTFSVPNNNGQWGEGIIVRGTMAEFWTAMSGFSYTSITDIFGQEADDWRPEIHPAVEIR